MYEHALNDITIMGDCICMNALYIILLKWELVFVWARSIWYYYNGRLYLSECALHDIIKMRVGICLNALYMILLWLEILFVWMRFKIYYKMIACMCLNALYMILLKWDLVCVWMRFIWYYKYESWYLSERSLYDITMMGDCICLNAL